jgi:predicted RNA binding protein YcfA (HicA-like mRNA interferase family)
MNGKSIIAKLKAAGWVLDRVNGSHPIMVKNGRAVSVPVHGNKDVGSGLVSAIARRSGVNLRGDRSFADLARALETSWPVAKKLEDPRHWPSLRALDRAAAALGKRLVLALE